MISRSPARSLLLLLLLLGSCRRSVPEAPAADQPPPAIEVLKNGRWLFSYVDADGRFATTDKPDIIPAQSRRAVRAIDPTRSVDDRRDLSTVYVVDVDELLKAGKVPARPLSREAFETAAMAQLPPGESSPRSTAPTAAAPAAAAPPAAGGAARGAAPAPPAPGAPPIVTLYGTSWCGACKAARAYLSGRGIPFADKDIERDPAAARELSEKGARLGVPTDRVPIIDVRGTLLVGFDRKRIEALLGAAT